MYSLIHLRTDINKRCQIIQLSLNLLPLEIPSQLLQNHNTRQIIPRFYHPHTQQTKPPSQFPNNPHELQAPQDQNHDPSARFEHVPSGTQKHLVQRLQVVNVLVPRHDTPGQIRDNGVNAVVIQFLPQSPCIHAREGNLILTKPRRDGVGPGPFNGLSRHVHTDARHVVVRGVDLQRLEKNCTAAAKRIHDFHAAAAAALGVGRGGKVVNGGTTEHGVRQICLYGHGVSKA
mmetsp:Transcript_38250/g.46678  ORF Transcript_38250/g.46678 Transcript_38250/m.46678 type:complete len:231 (-) Transcript_38250:798-1490(-)